MISYQCVCIFQTGLKRVKGLSQYEEQFAIGSRQRISIADGTMGKVKKMIAVEEMNEISRMMIVEGKYVVYGGNKGLVGIYSIEKKEIFVLRYIHEDDITGMIQINYKQFASSSLDNKIIIWNIN